MKAKFKKYAGIGMLIWGFMFLFNPEIAVIDILPDFIGYALICAGLTNLSDIYYQFADAKKAFSKGILISAAKLVSFFVLVGLFSYSERPVGMLLFTFVFAVLELIYIIPAYRYLFEGFLYASQRLDSDSVLKYAYNDRKTEKILKKCRKKGTNPQNLTVRAYKRAAVFVIIKNTLAVAPELTSLINNNQYTYIGLLRFFSVIICLVFGMFFLINTVRYFVALKKDKIFINQLEEKYNLEVLPKAHIFTQRKVSAMLTCSMTLAFLSINLYSDEINLIPQFLFFALAIFLFSSLKEYGKLKVRGTLLAVIGFAVSAVEWILSVIFYKNHYIGEVSKFPHAYKEYYTVAVFSVLQSLLFVATVAILLFVIYNIAKTHTGKPEYENGIPVRNKVHKFELFTYKKACVIAAVMAFISKLCYLFNIFASPFSINFWMIEMSPLIDTISSIIFALYFAYLCSNIKVESRKCYSEY